MIFQTESASNIFAPDKNLGSRAADQNVDEVFQTNIVMALSLSGARPEGKATRRNTSKGNFW